MFRNWKWGKGFSQWENNSSLDNFWKSVSTAICSLDGADNTSFTFAESKRDNFKKDATEDWSSFKINNYNFYCVSSFLKVFTKKSCQSCSTAVSMIKLSLPIFFVYNLFSEDSSIFWLSWLSDGKQLRGSILGRKATAGPSSGHLERRPRWRLAEVHPKVHDWRKKGECKRFRCCWLP